MTNKIEIEKINDLLDKVNQIIKIHEEHANKQGEKFNIFSILKMERREVETHSKFIYELLNPRGSHGQDRIFLKSFAKIVLESEVYETAINPRREDSTKDNRRIDFTLETNRDIIGIEMKIDAGDDENQLSDYKKELEKRAKNKNALLFYLSLNGKEAEEKSVKGVEYKCISFENDILNWINDCIKQSAEKSVLREALVQYKILIEKITGLNMGTNNEIAESLVENTEYFKSALAIEKSLKQAKINLQIKFWNELYEKLGGKDSSFYFCDTKHEATPSIDGCVKKYYTKGNNHRRYGLMINIKNSYIKKIYILVNHYLYYDYDTEGKEKEGRLNVGINNTESIGYKKINFLNFNEKTLDYLCDTNREETIKKIYKEVNDFIEQINKNGKTNARNK